MILFRRLSMKVLLVFVILHIVVVLGSLVRMVMSLLGTACMALMLGLFFGLFLFLVG